MGKKVVNCSKFQEKSHCRSAFQQIETKDTSIPTPLLFIISLFRYFFLMLLSSTFSEYNTSMRYDTIDSFSDILSRFYVSRIDVKLQIISSKKNGKKRLQQFVHENFFVIIFYNNKITFFFFFFVPFYIYWMGICS